MLTAYKNRTYKVLVPSHQEYDKLTAMMREDLIQYVKPFGYVYEFVRKHQYSNDVLIATNSDQLLHFEEIVKSCPELTFHIVAITEMSNTLIQYDKYHNVKLYPKANKATFNQLFNVCDIYLACARMTFSDSLSARLYPFDGRHITGREHLSN